MEKVIKGLECHRIDNNHRINCADCPYYVDDGDPIRCVNNLHDDAVAMLKEQEAVSITTDYFDGFGNRTSHCPSCNSRLVWHQNKNYCGECGKALKWE